MIENFGDAPFFKSRVPQHVVAHMTAIACAIRRRFDVPLGINCLRSRFTSHGGALSGPSRRISSASRFVVIFD
jgi:predicted TIM-barrel enzyme